MLQDNALYVTCEETCSKMTAAEWVAELQKKQTLVCFGMHCMLLKLVRKAFIVTTEDTDVMVLCLAFQKDIPCPIYQKCGTQNRTRFVDITKLAWSLGETVCDSLIGLHPFTGYDTLSAFASRGTMSALKLMKRNISYHEAFLSSWTVMVCKTTSI